MEQGKNQPKKELHARREQQSGTNDSELVKRNGGTTDEIKFAHAHGYCNNNDNMDKTIDADKSGSKAARRHAASNM